MHFLQLLLIWAGLTFSQDFHLPITSSDNSDTLIDAIHSVEYIQPDITYNTDEWGNDVMSLGNIRAWMTNPNIDVSGDFTISFWYYINQTTPSQFIPLNILEQKHDEYINGVVLIGSYGLKVNLNSSSSVEMTFYSGMESHLASIHNSNTWHGKEWSHISIVVNKSTGIDLYIDGDLSGHTDIYPSHFDLSQANGKTGDWLNYIFGSFMWIDDFRFYNSALTQTEINNVIGLIPERLGTTTTQKSELNVMPKHKFYPNPFSSRLTLNKDNVKIYDIQGRLINRVNKYWYGKDFNGTTVPAGLYIVGNRIITKK